MPINGLSAYESPGMGPSFGMLLHRPIITRLESKKNKARTSDPFEEGMRAQNKGA